MDPRLLRLEARLRRVPEDRACWSLLAHLARTRGVFPSPDLLRPGWIRALLHEDTSVRGFETLLFGALRARDPYAWPDLDWPADCRGQPESQDLDRGYERVTRVAFETSSGLSLVIQLRQQWFRLGPASDPLGPRHYRSETGEVFEIPGQGALPEGPRRQSRFAARKAGGLGREP